MKRLIITLAALTIVFIASGCGQSGPLYIPGDPSSIETAEQPADDAEDGDDDSEDADRP